MLLKSFAMISSGSFEGGVVKMNHQSDHQHSLYSIFEKKNNNSKQSLKEKQVFDKALNIFHKLLLSFGENNSCFSFEIRCALF